MRKITADYIFPIASKPLKNGVIILDDKGVIIDIISCLEGDIVLQEAEHYEGILCPGFINTHCHLELSFFKGMLAERTGLDIFIRDILALQRPELDIIMQFIADAEEEMIRNGIVAVGDISNGNTTYYQKLKRNLEYHTFIELFAFETQKSKSIFENGVNLFNEYPAGLKKSITPHAPYSVSDDLFKMIHDFSLNTNAILSIHNQECDGENELFQTKSGKLYELISRWGLDTSDWQPTGKNSLESILPKLPVESKILLVHNTASKSEDIVQATSHHPHLYWCFCPNANLYIENKLADFDKFMKADAKITIGTDSYASNWSLSVLDELKTISQFAPGITLEKLLLWATKNGAEFLNFSDRLGTLEKSKQPGINLLYNLDLDKLKLTPATKVKKIQ